MCRLFQQNDATYHFGNGAQDPISTAIYEALLRLCMDVNMSVLIFNNHWDEMTCFVDTRTLRRIQGDIDSMIVGCHF